VGRLRLEGPVERRVQRGFSKISLHHFSCSTARNQGSTACSSLLTIRREVPEETVLGALHERLIDPELFETFVKEFAVGWSRLQAEASAGLTAGRQELERVERQLAKLVEGCPGQCGRGAHGRSGGPQGAAGAELQGADAPAPRLRPALAQVYRPRIAELTEALEADDGAELRERVRSLVEAIRLIPEVCSWRRAPETAKAPTSWPTPLLYKFGLDCLRRHLLDPPADEPLGFDQR
jgi:hypothetical protein